MQDNTVIDNTFSKYHKRPLASVLAEKHGKAYVEYREEWEKASRGDYLADRPLYILLSVNSNCNLRCKMCFFRETSILKKIELGVDMVAKLAEECKRFNVPSLMVGANAECLLHPEIKEITRLLSKENSGIIDYFLITNGTRLTEEMARHLIDVGLDRLSISLDAATPETYKAIRGGNLDMVEGNIRRFLELRAEAGTPWPLLRLSFVKQELNFHEAEAFVRKWKDVADLVEVDDFVIYDRPASEYGTFGHMKPFKCVQPWQKLEVDFYGNIFPCCYRFFDDPALRDKLLLGNLRDMTIMDAWTGDRIKALRRTFEDGKNLPICQFCMSYLDRETSDFSQK